MNRTVAMPGADPGASGSTARPRVPIRGPLARAALLIGLIAGLAAQPALATGGSSGSGGGYHPSCSKPADSDGNASEWEAEDKVAVLKWTTHEKAYLYLRCDPSQGEVNAMVRVKSGFSLYSNNTANWIAVDGQKCDKTSASYSEIVENGVRVGFECSFPNYDFSTAHSFQASAKVKVNGSGYVATSSTFEHSFACQGTPTGTPFEQDPTTGLVCFQAEDYHTAIAARSHEWKLDTAAPAGASGGVVRAMPDTGLLIAKGDYAPDKSPRMDYSVKFNRTGQHYFWARFYANNDDGNSIHQGFDGTGVSDGLLTGGVAKGVQTNTYNQYVWVEGAPFSVASKGTHAVNVWMREDGTRIDEICVTGNPDYDPNAPVDEPTDPAPVNPEDADPLASCGRAVIDGDFGEWNLQADYIAPMHEAGDLTKTKLSDLFMRYEDGVAYVLVLTDGQAANQSPTDAWIKIYSMGTSTLVDGNSANFEWVYAEDGTLIGYEAAFDVAPGTYNQFEAHLNVQGDTSSTGKPRKSGYITVELPDCGGGTPGECESKSAAVDGAIGEWDLGADLLTPMVREGTSTQTADLYVRYDAQNGTAYVLALARSPYYAINYLDWNFVKLNGQTVVTATNNTSSTTFRWVSLGGKLMGYEASFPLPVGTSPAQIFAQLKTDSSTTSHFKSQGSGEIDTSCDEGVCTEGEDFEGLAKGTILTNQIPGITVTGSRTGKTETNKAMIFDTANPTGGDSDLGTPATAATGNGPGNTQALGMVVIVSEDGSTANPDDNAGGGTLTFTFSEPKDLVSVKLVDIEEAGGSIKAYAPNGALLAEVAIPKQANNGVQSVPVSAADVKTLVVKLAGSGALAEILYECEEQAPEYVGIGNQLWVENGMEPGYQTGEQTAFQGADGTRIPVLVELYEVTASGTVRKGDTLTDESGCYFFPNLSEGRYFVSVPASQFATGGPLAGYLPLGAAGGDDGRDDNLDQNGSLDLNGNFATGVFELSVNGEPTGERANACSSVGNLKDENVDLTADLALLAPAPEKVALGNRVWIDRDRNSAYDSAADLPAAGVRVDLMSADDQVLESRTTDSNGCYLFDDLSEGGYYVRIAADQLGSGALAGLSVAASAGTAVGTDDNVDQNGYLAGGNVRTQLYSLSGNAQPIGEPSSGCGPTPTVDDDNANLTADIAFVDNRVALGNRVWIEKNGQSGYQPGADTPASGVAVELLDFLGNPIPGRTATTTAEGCYLFDGLAAGVYQVQIPASQLAAGGSLAGTVPAKPVGANETDDDTLDHNAADADFLGNVRSANVYDLAPGAEPAGERACGPVPFVPDTNANLTADFAFTPKVAIGNLVWVEKNGQPGYQEGADSPAPSIPVEVVNQGTGAVTPTVTDGSGCYLADNLPEGSYIVRIPQSGLAGTVLEGLATIAAASGDADDNADQNGSDNGSGYFMTGSYLLTAGNQPLLEAGVACASKPTTLPDANVNLTADFAFEGRVAIGNLVWEELNGQPGFNAGDNPLSGIEVGLYDADGNLVATDTTNNDGCYLFDGMDPSAQGANASGTYYVAIDGTQAALGGRIPVPNAGVDETIDDNADHNGVDFGGSVETNLYTLAPGTQPTGELGAACATKQSALPDGNVNLTADFAFTQPPPVKFALGNLVWIEANGVDGYQDGVDQPLSGVTVQLMAEGAAPGDTPLRETETVGGCYLFDDLDAGTYYVRIPAAEFTTGGTLNGYGSLPDPDGEGGPLTAYGDDGTTDDDLDQNGRPEQGATGNVVSNLFVLTDGNVATNETGEACGGVASALPDSHVNRTADFAFEAKVAIGNLVWVEGNGSAGYQTGTADQPVSQALGQEVQVRLHRVRVDDQNQVTSDDVVNSMQTQGGFYLFDRLSPGLYYVEIPAGEFDTGALAGYESVSGWGTDETLDDTVDENGIDEANPEQNGVASRIYDLQAFQQPAFEPGQQNPSLTSLLPDESVNLTADFAFVEGTPPGVGLMSLGSTVYLDLNHNGRLDANEPVVPGVTVELIDPDLPFPIATDTTEDSGEYFFGGLDDGVAYRVRIPAAQMDAGNPAGVLGRFIRDYYAALVPGVPIQVPAQALSTRDTAGSDSDSRIDHDDNGIQEDGPDAGSLPFGEEALSPEIVLDFGLEPLNGSDETPLGNDTAGYNQDNLGANVDANGDMTVDFGFVHQCQSTCDMDNNGVVNQADIDLISASLGNLPEGVEPGAPGSGDCGQTGIVTRNDRTWCRVFVNQNLQ